MLSSSSIWAEVIVAVAMLQYTLGTRTTMTPKHISIEEGADSITFTCVSHLEPIESVQSHWMEWKKTNVTIVQNDVVLTDQVKYTVSGSSKISAVIIIQNLTVHNIELSDSGNYSCTLESTSQFFVKSSSSAELSVSALKTKMTPKYISIDEGADSIVFVCVSNLEPIEAIQSHWMEWKKNNVMIVRNDIVLVDEAKYSLFGSSKTPATTVIQHLTVHNIQVSDSGNYSCTLEFESSQFFVKSSSSAELSVRALKTKMTPKYISIDEGADSIVFMCVSNLEPIEAIQSHWIEWRKNNVTIVRNDTVLVEEAKYSVDGSSKISAIIIKQNLTVHNIHVSDSGIYSCNLESNSQFLSKSSSSAELSVSALKQMTDVMKLTNEKDNTEIIISFTAGGVILVLSFLGCIVIMYKIRSNDSAIDNNHICSDDLEKERRISFYSNIDTNVTEMNTYVEAEMTEKTESTYQNDLNIGLNDDSTNNVNTV